MMTKTKQPKNMTSTPNKPNQAGLQQEPVLNEAINMAFASKIIATTPAPEIASRIKSKLMQRVKSQNHQFVFANQGEWKQVIEGVQIKLLRQEGEQKSFLLKMMANSSIPSHAHSKDEESFVIEGSVELEGILCHAGDYHFAQAGSHHQTIRSTQGCTLLVKSI